MREHICYVTPEFISGEDVKDKRHNLGMTQRDFAQILGVSQKTIERWEATQDEIRGPIVLLLQMLDENYLSQIEVPKQIFPIRMWYMYMHQKCTLIDVDDASRLVRIRNYTKDVRRQAFGSNPYPNYADYIELLEDRCLGEANPVVESMFGATGGIDFLKIIEQTEGRLKKDHFWIQLEAGDRTGPTG